MATQLMIEGTKVAVQDPAFALAVADAHRRQRRPRCTCQPAGVEMYVAKAGDGFVVKRMPYTASRHATHCPHACIAGSPTIRVRASPTRSEARSTDELREHNGELDRLLHGLWERAGLTRWHPGFEGKRNWTAVRHRLLMAAITCRFRGRVLADRLFVPEPFRLEHMSVIEERRRKIWVSEAELSSRQPGLLVLGTLKRLDADRDAALCIIKHLPTQPLAMHARVRDFVNQKYQGELSFCGASPLCHLVVLAAVTLSHDSTPTIRQLALMSVTPHWLPATNALDAARVERLVQTKRSFVVDRLRRPIECIAREGDSRQSSQLGQLRA